MDERFLRSWFAPRARHECLGLTLLPYSLSHLLVLEAVDSPLLQHGERVEVPDLVLAVRLCSQPQFPVVPRRTAFRLRDQIWRVALETNKPLFYRESKKLLGYLKDHSSFPEFWDDAGNVKDDRDTHDPAKSTTSDVPASRPASGPYILSQAVAVLQAFPQFSEERVWTMSLGTLSWYYGQYLESKGIRRIWSDEEAELTEATLVKAEAQITPEMREKAERIKAKFEASQKKKVAPVGETFKLWTPDMPTPRMTEGVILGPSVIPPKPKSPQRFTKN